MKNSEFTRQETGDRIRKRIFWLLASGFWLLALCVHAQETPTDIQVKAIFLEKFGKFVEWPPDAFADTNAPLVIGLFDGSDAFAQTLEAVAAKDLINGRRVEVRRIKALPDLRGCQILYLPATQSGRENEILDAVQAGQMPILTVGETDNFYRAGGMIEFIIEDRQVHFRIHNAVAREAGLKISSKLLSLARP